MEFNGTFQRHSSRKWRMFSDIHDIAVKLRSDASPPYEQVQSVTAAWVRRKVERTDYETETLVKTGKQFRSSNLDTHSAGSSASSSSNAKVEDTQTYRPSIRCVTVDYVPLPSDDFQKDREEHWVVDRGAGRGSENHMIIVL